MKLGFIGLGRMGQAMVLNFLEKGIEVVVYNRTAGKMDDLSKAAGNPPNLVKSNSFRDFLAKLPKPRIIWLMVDHGKAVDDVIGELIQNGLEKDDIVIDGGNSFYKDSVRRFEHLKSKGVHFLDAGTSGGIEGARNGACLMVGGEKAVFEKVRPYFEKAAGKNGIASYFGPAGAGHFVKMVHNGVEYGMIQAIGEGFEILEKSNYKPDLEKVAVNWSKGSVVRGWLMDLLAKALRENPGLREIEGRVGGGSTGEWTVETAKNLNVKTPVIEASLKARKESQRVPTFAGKVVAALRKQFGGHEFFNISRQEEK
ncbi:MAG: 6-phosphogluconate dehydrogenase, 6-phosphogluconate dehydrogenase [Candidatus Gottesmanbacteria bacterium GW2011_GWA2_43_14]|uniref:6-phosphogluconate dehydrogenase, 6-phosphogluconate dehydrogenase n=1 Tax=Candidatus Gottesmanbacteria bacterium GW2011_GWA2_43_14 TaxID=1618443 RepID=A0A0G1FKE2_9BACT|nr:MAG: 6-phosphogluconate dehydrogenase, 6-phosphogluconate dehydrogenase [Candidatus Gottesmanbacteria bacterium GW2011_GWA2_43_14]